MIPTQIILGETLYSIFESFESIMSDVDIDCGIISSSTGNLKFCLSLFDEIKIQTAEKVNCLAQDLTWFLLKDGY